MDELFRFVTLRPALPVAPEETTHMRPSAEVGEAVRGARNVAERVRKLRAHKPVVDLSKYRFGAAMAQLGEWAEGAALTPQAVADQLDEITGKRAEALTDDPAFAADVERLDDSLLVLKFAAIGGADGLVTARLDRARRGYDLVEQVAAGADDVRLRRPVLELDEPTAHRAAKKPAPTKAPAPAGPSREQLDRKLTELVAARDALRQAIRGGFTVPAPHEEREGAPAAAIERAAHQKSLSVAPGSALDWRLDGGAVKGLNRKVITTLEQHAGDPSVVPATALSQRMGDAIAEVKRQQAAGALDLPHELTQLGSKFYARRIDLTNQASGGVAPLTVKVRPVGIGDLLIVREHVKRYEGGELSHIENVLRTEKLERDTRRLDRVEQTTTVEVETDKEEERDTQTTERFSLKRETDSTVKTDAEVKAGLNVDYKYGPMLEVKADVSGSYQHQTEDVAKQATEFSKDVVSRSVSKLVTKARTLQTTTTLREFEEKYVHGFDNSSPDADNVSGVYQFVDKVSEAQVYNYGKRLLFDVIVPEPASFYIWAQQHDLAETTHLTPPPALTVTPSDLDEGNYQVYAQAYGATGIDPPPPLHRTFSQAWDATVAGDPHLFVKSGTMNLDDGYAAISAAAAAQYNFPSDQTPIVRVVLAGGSMNLPTNNPVAYRNLSGEEGTISVGVYASHINAVTISLEILCERTDRAYALWQEKAYAAIASAYQQKLSDYQHALADLQAAQATSLTGRNPGANTAIIAAELRKACLEELTTQHFDLFGAIEPDAEGRPELELVKAGLEAPYIRFFEEAFEWERIVYFFYPYFWAAKDTWAQRSLLDDDADPNFGHFLRAGAARVVFPVRPGFEKAVVHYLETGMIWNGGDPPDISSSLYVSIVEEIAEAEQRPGTEVPVGDPWDVRVPTPLVKLRPDDTLPSWHKNGSTWLPD